MYSIENALYSIENALYSIFNAIQGIGWSRGYLVHNWMFHADIRLGKIWIEADWTEYSIAQELIDRKIAPSDIVTIAA